MNENEIMNIMNNIEYGWIDKDGSRHVDDFDTFSSDYRLQSPDELKMSKLGVCWDQVELERELFKDIQVRTFFIVHYDDDKCPTHTFLTYEKDSKYYWFEHSWEIHRGIHVYNSLTDLIKDVKEKFIQSDIDNYIEDHLYIYEYTKPNYNLTVQEFYKHCEQGIVIFHEE